MTFLAKVEMCLDLPPALKAEVMKELETHYKDVLEELIASGMDRSQAETEAASRLGKAEDVAARLSAAHNTASWKSAVLTAAPFVASALAMLLSQVKMPHIHLIAIAVLGLVASIGSIRELIIGRRPVWLTTWLAFAMICVYDLIKFILETGARQVTTVSTGLAIITLVFCWKMKPWRWAVGVMGIICAASLIYCFSVDDPEKLNIIPIFLSMLSFLSLIIYFARSVFEKHPYGNEVLASLFLLSIFAIRLAIEKQSIQGEYQIAGMLVFSMVIFRLTRLSSCDRKTRLICWAILWPAFLHAVPFVMDDSLPFKIVGLIFGTLFQWAFLYFIITWPVKTKRTQELEFLKYQPRR